MVKKIKSMLKRIIKIIIKKYRTYIALIREDRIFKTQLELHNIPNKKVAGEDLYKKKWSVICKMIEPYTYRLMSHYVGQTPNIVPENMAHKYLEPILNPVRFKGFYSDKNTYAMYIDRENLPKTILCRISTNVKGGGRILKGDYSLLSESLENYLDSVSYSRLVLKPSIDSYGGKDVMLFERKNGKWFSDETELTEKFLLEYSKNFVLQEAISQHPYISQFCSTSVNTIRIGVYRSVNDESINILGTVLRIGKEGAVMDNVTSGGVAIAIDKKSGKLGGYVRNAKQGIMSNVWNGVDFSKKDFIIPDWGKVLEFAKVIGSRIMHCRLFSLDVALNNDGKPILVEYNVGGFSYRLFMSCGQLPLGDFTDEIIEYCKTEKSD